MQNWHSHGQTKETISVQSEKKKQTAKTWGSSRMWGRWPYTTIMKMLDMKTMTQSFTCSWKVITKLT